MKVALCLSGQARFLSECFYESMKPNILDVYHPDVFIHTWDTLNMSGKFFINGGNHVMGKEIPENLMQVMLELYKPTRYLIQSQKVFESGKWSGRLMPGIKSDHLLSMFYSIKQSNDLKQKYEQENNFTYDWVIRIRFDMALPSGPLTLEELDSNYLWVATGCFDRTNGYLDSFGYSNSANMDIYAQTYDNVIPIIENNPKMGICGEYVLRKHLDSKNIKVREIGTHKAYR